MPHCRCRRGKGDQVRWSAVHAAIISLRHCNSRRCFRSFDLLVVVLVEGDQDTVDVVGCPLWPSRWVHDCVVVPPFACGRRSKGAGAQVILVDGVGNEVGEVLIPQRSSLQARGGATGDGSCSEHGGSWPHGGAVLLHGPFGGELGFAEDFGAGRRKAADLNVEVGVLATDVVASAVLEGHCKLSPGHVAAVIKLLGSFRRLDVGPFQLLQPLRGRMPDAVRSFFASSR